MYACMHACMVEGGMHAHPHACMGMVGGACMHARKHGHGGGGMHAHMHAWAWWGGHAHMSVGCIDDVS